MKFGVMIIYIGLNGQEIRKRKSKPGFETLPDYLESLVL